MNEIFENMEALNILLDLQTKRVLEGRFNLRSNEARSKALFDKGTLLKYVEKIE